MRATRVLTKHIILLRRDRFTCGKKRQMLMSTPYCRWFPNSPLASILFSSLLLMPWKRPRFACYNFHDGFGVICHISIHFPAIQLCHKNQKNQFLDRLWIFRAFDSIVLLWLLRARKKVEIQATKTCGCSVAEENPAEPHLLWDFIKSEMPFLYQ